MKAGEFAKWTSKDEKGEFSHVGRLIEIGGEYTKMQIAEGIIEFKATDGTIEPHNEIELKTLETVTVESTEKETKVKKAKARKQAKEGSKAARSLEIVKANPSMSRKDLIEILMKELSMSKAGASTYHSNAKKALEGKQ